MELPVGLNGGAPHAPCADTLLVVDSGLYFAPCSTCHRCGAQTLIDHSACLRVSGTRCCWRPPRGHTAVDVGSRPSESIVRISCASKRCLRFWTLRGKSTSAPTDLDFQAPIFSEHRSASSLDAARSSSMPIVTRTT